MVAGGALVVAVLPLVRFTGALLAGADAGGVLLLAAVAVVVPAALLSAVPPMVVKLQLASLAETGLGRRPALGHRHAGRRSRPRSSTGFLLIAVLPSSVILVGTGAVTVVGRHRRRRAAPPRAPRRRRARAAGAARPRRRRSRARGGRADAVRGGDRLPLRPRRRRPRAGDRPGAAARHPAALLRRPGRPDPPRVRVRAGHRRGHRRRRAGGRAAVGAAHRRRRADAAALPRRGPARHREPGDRGRSRAWSTSTASSWPWRPPTSCRCGSPTAGSAWPRSRPAAATSSSATPSAGCRCRGS